MTTNYVTILSWNIDGLGFLRTKKVERVPKRREINEALLNSVIAKYHPHFVLLQEVVQYEDDDRNKTELIEIEKFQDSYSFQSAMVIDTDKNNHPGKWGPIRKKGKWGDSSFLAQGTALLWQKDIPHCSIWEDDEDKLSMSGYLEQEIVRLDNGLYIGDRDSEPRTATISRFSVHGRDLFIVNLHLTTLKGEREGFPEKDEMGSKLRFSQLDIILNGIVSRYNIWREHHENLKMRPKPLWLLAGDFNGTELSPEIQRIKRMRFQDISPLKEVDGIGSGTKRSKDQKKASITLDYIFAGIEYYSFDPYEMKKKLQLIPPEYDVKTSDHYPIVAKFPLP